MKIEPNTVMQMFEPNSFYNWVNKNTLSPGLAAKVMETIQAMIPGAKSNVASVEAVLDHCYKATLASFGLVMVTVRMKGSRSTHSVLGNLALQTSIVCGVSQEMFIDCWAPTMKDLDHQIFSEGYAIDGGVNFNTLRVWLTAHTGKVEESEKLFEQIVEMVMNNDLNLAVLRFQRGNARRRASLTRLGLIKLDVFATKDAAKPIGTYVIGTHYDGFAQREHIDYGRFEFQPTVLFKNAKPVAEQDRQALSQVFNHETIQSAQEADIMTNSKPTVTTIVTEQGCRMTPSEFGVWLAKAYGNLPINHAQANMDFYTLLGGGESDDAELRFSTRRILPITNQDLSSLENATGLIDVALLADDQTRALKQRVVRFVTLRTKLVLQDDQQLQEQVDQILQPSARGMSQMSVINNKRYTLGELGVFMIGDDRAMEPYAEHAIKQIQQTYTLLKPDAKESDTSNLAVYLDRVCNAALHDTHRVTEGVITGRVYGPFGTDDGFTFNLLTDFTTDPRTGCAVEVICEFMCEKLKELTEAQTRAARAEKESMRPGSFYARQLQSQTEPVSLTAQALPSVTPVAAHEVLGMMNWGAFLCWLQASIQPVIAGRMTDASIQLMDSIMERIHYNIGYVTHYDYIVGYLPEERDALVGLGTSRAFQGVLYAKFDVDPDGEAKIRIFNADKKFLTYVGVKTQPMSLGGTNVLITGLVDQQLRERMKVEAAVKVEAPAQPKQKVAPETTFNTDAFAFFNHALGGLITMVTEEEADQARAFVEFCDQLFPQKGVSGETYEVYFQEHGSLQIEVKRHDFTVARVHFNLQ